MMYEVTLTYKIILDDVQDATEAIEKARYTIVTIPEINPAEIQVQHKKEI